jgi:GntR family galactonate operon transcriptional repressor
MLRNHSLAKDMAADLIARIARAELPSGSALDPLALEAQYDVSRTVVREALAELSVKGLVASRQKAGTHVQDETAWDFLDVRFLFAAAHPTDSLNLLGEAADLRALVEPEIAAQAALSTSAIQRQKVQTAFDRMQQARAVHSIEGFLKADYDLHAAITEACQNRLLRSLGRVLLGLHAANRDRIFARTQKEGFLNQIAERSLALHGAVVQAIQAQNADAAREATKALAYESRALLSPIAKGRAVPSKIKATAGRKSL